jgi:hypothetical protein
MLELAENVKLNALSLQHCKLFVLTSNQLHTLALSTPNMLHVPWELIILKEEPFAILLNSTRPVGN